MSSIYFDYNATSPATRQVVKLVSSLYGEPLNPSSVHESGRKARKLLQQARTDIMKSVGANGDSYRLIFTSSGTEANNMVISRNKCSKVLVGATEHVSVLKVRDDVGVIEVDNNGAVDLESLIVKLKENGDNCLVSIMLANNETGVISQIDQI